MQKEKKKKCLEWGEGILRTTALLNGCSITGDKLGSRIKDQKGYLTSCPLMEDCYTVLVKQCLSYDYSQILGGLFRSSSAPFGSSWMYSSPLHPSCTCVRFPSTDTSPSRSLFNTASTNQGLRPW